MFLRWNSTGLVLALFAVLLAACGGDNGDGATAKPDHQAPLLVEITPIQALGSNATPSYTFSSDEEGTITYHGDCTSVTTTIVKGSNTITLDLLNDGVHDNCWVEVTDKAGNASVALTLTPFTIDATAPVLSEVTAISNPATDTTPSYTFNSSEEGSVRYEGDCWSSTDRVIAGNATVVLSELNDGFYDNCSIIVTDAAGNASDSLAISPFEIRNFWVTSIVPSATLTAGVVTKLSGYGLEDVMVTLNGVALVPTVQNPYEFRFIAPELAVGEYTLELSKGESVRQKPVYVRPRLQAANFSSGAGHACAVDLSGKVLCWGSNSLGQLGNGGNYYTQNTTPAYVTGIDSAEMVSSGSDHTCALLADHTVACWGSNADGALGNGLAINSRTPVAVMGIDNAIAISAGAEHTCAVLSDHTIKCWGSNSQGQLGSGALDEFSLFPVQVAGIATAVAVNAGTASTCAVLQDKTAMCWGDNGLGQLGNGNNADSSVPVAVSGLSGVVSLDIALKHGCAALEDMTVRCWGSNHYGMLGDGTLMDHWLPEVVEGVDAAVNVSLGDEQTCAVMQTGAVKCWGRNYYNLLGLQEIGPVFSPVDVDGMDEVSAISFGTSYACLLKQDDSLWCWGKGVSGELGMGEPTFMHEVVTQSDISSANIVGESNSSSMYFENITCVLIQGVGVKCAGFSYNSGVSLELLPIIGMETAIDMTLNMKFGCALMDDRSIKCWGGDYGSFWGNYLTDISNAIMVDAGGRSACAVLEDGSVRCWGVKFAGLGDGINTYTATTESVIVSGIDSAIAVSVGGVHSCALLSDGTVKCWGANTRGQLGNGSITSSSVPVMVDGISTAIAIESGSMHSCALLADRTVRCWGNNVAGQLGDVSTINRLSPVEVSSLSGVKSLTAGEYHTCAVRLDGTAWCWGKMLGGPVSSFSTVPQRVNYIHDAVSMAASSSSTCALLTGGYVQCWGSVLERYFRSAPTVPVYLY